MFAAIDQDAAKYWLPTVGGASAAGVGVDAAIGVIGAAGADVGAVIAGTASGRTKAPRRLTMASSLRSKL